MFKSVFVLISAIARSKAVSGRSKPATFWNRKQLLGTAPMRDRWSMSNVSVTRSSMRLMSTQRNFKRRKLQLRHLQCSGYPKGRLPPGCCPGFWEDVFNLTIGHGRQAGQHVVEISVGLDAVAPAAFDD